MGCHESYLLRMQGVDSWEHRLQPLQPPTQSMVDGEPISDPRVVSSIGALLLDLVESCSPLRIRMLPWVSPTYLDRGGFRVRDTYLERGRSAPRNIVHDNLGVVVFEDAQKTGQVGVAAGLARKVQTAVAPSAPRCVCRT